MKSIAYNHKATRKALSFRVAANKVFDLNYIDDMSQLFKILRHSRRAPTHTMKGNQKY